MQRTVVSVREGLGRSVGKDPPEDQYDKYHQKNQYDNTGNLNRLSSHLLHRFKIVFPRSNKTSSLGFGLTQKRKIEMVYHILFNV